MALNIFVFKMPIPYLGKYWKSTCFLADIELHFSRSTYPSSMATSFWTTRVYIIHIHTQKHSIHLLVARDELKFTFSRINLMRDRCASHYCQATGMVDEYTYHYLIGPWREMRQAQNMSGKNILNKVVATFNAYYFNWISATKRRIISSRVVQKTNKQYKYVYIYIYIFLNAILVLQACVSCIFKHICFPSMPIADLPVISLGQKNYGPFSLLRVCFF